MDRIDKYELHGRIGSGGFATVWKGYDPFIKRAVAVKVCHANDDESRQRFFREAEIAGRLRHENITTVYDFGVHRDEPYLVEEYLDGEDLAHFVRRGQPEDLATKIDFLAQIARGLEYAHREGVIHRDIKPGNVRVLSDGVLKIMDFGTARLAEVESHLTQQGMTLGTVAYLSPERLLGRETGTNSDLFSFGVLAYELLSFRRPFSGRSIPHLIDQVLNAAPVLLVDSWPDCPPKLADVVHRCLEKDPQKRYATASEILADLENVSLSILGRVPPSLRGDGTGAVAVAATDEDAQVNGFFERAKKLHADGRTDRAMMMLEEVLEMAPEHAEARELLESCSASVRTAPPPPPRDETPEERRARQRSEAVTSIEGYLEQRQLAEASDALAFAERMFGPLPEAGALAGRLREAARRELSMLKGEALRASRKILDQMIALREKKKLDLASARVLAGRVLDFDPDALAARDLLAIVAEESRPSSVETGARSGEKARKWADAVASIEAHLARGDASTAAQALDFAVGLYGELRGADELRRRIDAALAG